MLAGGGLLGFSSLNSGESSLAVETSPWAVQIDTSQVVLADVLCASFESWLPSSRPVLSVWKSHVQSWLDQR